MKSYYISEATTNSKPIHPNMDKTYHSIDSARKNAGIKCYDKYYRNNFSRQPPLSVYSYVFNADTMECLGLVCLSYEHYVEQFNHTSYFWMKKWARNEPIYPMNKHTGEIGKSLKK